MIEAMRVIVVLFLLFLILMILQYSTQYIYELKAGGIELPPLVEA